MRRVVAAILFCWFLLMGLLGHGAGPSSARTDQKTFHGSGVSPAATTLDFEFFKIKVQPIFLAKRPGHARCVACHGWSQATGFRLQPLPRGRATWNEEESRKNFEAVSEVVIPGDLRSPLLVHPLAESAGGDFFHSGGKHFNSQDDPEWQTLKAWVMGQTLSGSQ
jgi:hypothetical protein